MHFLQNHRLKTDDRTQQHQIKIDYGRLLLDQQIRHPSYCSMFIESLLQAKRKLVQEHNLCLNSLGSHFVHDCPSKQRIWQILRNVTLKHNFVLHNYNIQPMRRISLSVWETQFTSQQRPHQTSFGASQATPLLSHTNVNSVLITVPVTFKFNKFVSVYVALGMGRS